MKTLNRILIGAILATSLNVAADEATPSPTRTILQRHDQSGVAGKEVVLGTATLPPGSALAFHVHPGDESGYLLKGSVILKIKDQPDRTLKPGDFFFIPRGTVHSLAALQDGEGGLALSTWIVDKDKPLATPVPN